MKFYSYVSSKADYDPVRTVFLCAPSSEAKSIETVELFCKNSKWIEQIEENSAILIAPTAPQGWDDVSLSSLIDLFKNIQDSFKSLSGRSIPGRNGFLWLWESLVYIVGYEEGANYVSNVVVSNPGFFAAAALIGGGITDYSLVDKETSKWFVSNAKNYDKKNYDIASAVFFSEKNMEIEKSFEYFNSIPGSIIKFSDLEGDSSNLPKEIMTKLFSKVVRWKSGPDGSLKKHIGKKDFYHSGRYIHDEIIINKRKYPFALYFPRGKTKEDSVGLPVIFSLHGRGEPAWMFATKNGWEDLADETQEFVVVIPDSPQNIWNNSKDLEFIPTIVKRLIEEYNFDEERFYLTGFSNGALFTNFAASSYPELFAAASPWSGPGIEQCRNFGIDPQIYSKDFKNLGFEIPFCIMVGDSDDKAAAYRDDELEILNKVNNCVGDFEIWDNSNKYTIDNNYVEGNRLTTKIYKNKDNVIMNSLTIVKNLPHGAIYDESRAAWDFMKRFKRIKKQRKITLI